MGDRVRVAITVHKTVLPILFQSTKTDSLDKFSEEVGAEETEENQDLVEFVAYDVNYGEWDDLESILKNKKLEYDKEWAAGSEFEEGQAYHRQLSATKWGLIELYSGQKLLLDELKILLEEKDIRKAIQKKINQLEIQPYTDLKDIRSNAEKYITDIPEE